MDEAPEEIASIEGGADALEQWAESLATAEFSVAFRGYDPREVRELLDRAAEALRGPHSPAPTPTSAEPDLPPAQARREARSLLSAVDAEATSLREAAHRDATAIVTDAQAEATRIIEVARDSAQVAMADGAHDVSSRTERLDDAEGAVVRVRAEAERQAEEMMIEAAQVARQTVADGERRAAARILEVESLLATRWREVEEAERKLGGLRSDVDDTLRRADDDAAARRAEAEHEAQRIVVEAHESITSLSEARARAEQELDDLSRRSEEARAAAQGELYAMRRELEDTRAAMAEAEARRRQARQLWAQEWAAVRSHVSQVADLVRRVGPETSLDSEQASSPAGTSDPQEDESSRHEGEGK